MDDETAVQEGDPNATAAAAAAGATNGGPLKDGSKILLSNGVARLDYIRKRWKEGASRSVITKEVNELRAAGSNEIPYQIVFSATKGVPGGPPKAAPAEAATGEGAQQTAV